MLADYREIVPDYVRDDSSIINPTDVDQAILSAVTELDRVKPKSTVTALTEASDTSSFTLPGDWQDDFSSISIVEYPAGQVPPVVVDKSAYKVWVTPTGSKLLLDVVVPASEPLWVTSTSPYVLSDSTDDIPVHYRHSVSLLAAALVCDQLAAFYSGESDSNFAADVADHGGKSKYFRASASRYRTSFYCFFNASAPKASAGPAAAGAITTTSVEASGKYGWMFRDR